MTTTIAPDDERRRKLLKRKAEIWLESDDCYKRLHELSQELRRIDIELGTKFDERS